MKFCKLQKVLPEWQKSEYSENNLEIVKSYENHPSILQIKSIFSLSFHILEKFCFHFVNEIERRKATGFKSLRLVCCNIIPEAAASGVM